MHLGRPWYAPGFWSVFERIFSRKASKNSAKLQIPRVGDQGHGGSKGSSHIYIYVYVDRVLNESGFQGFLIFRQGQTVDAESLSVPIQGRVGQRVAACATLPSQSTEFGRGCEKYSLIAAVIPARS